MCGDGKRDAKVLCVVARVHDLMAIERAGVDAGALLRPRAAALAARGDRPGGPADREAGRADPRRRGHRGHRRDPAERRRRSDGAPAQARARGRSASRSRASRAGCRTAAIWSSPTPSRWGAPSRAVARCRLAASCPKCHRDEARPCRDRPVLAGDARGRTASSSAGRSRSTRPPGQIVAGDVAAQAERVLKNLEADPRRRGLRLRRRRADDDLSRRSRALRRRQRGLRAVLRSPLPRPRDRSGLRAAPWRARRDRRDRHRARLRSSLFRAGAPRAKARRRPTLGALAVAGRQTNGTAPAASQGIGRSPTPTATRKRGGASGRSDRGPGADRAPVDAHDREELANARGDEDLVRPVEILGTQPPLVDGDARPPRRLAVRARA